MYFYDTCALLNMQGAAFESLPFAISEETLREIESIKTSASKDADVKYKARTVARLLVEHASEYEVVYTPTDRDTHGDERIRLDLLRATRLYSEPIIFVTDDLACRLLASAQGVESVIGSDTLLREADTYTGFKIYECDREEQQAYFYENLGVNTAECLVNQYVILKANDEYIDIYKWTGSEYAPLYNKTLKSTYLEDTKAKDVFQRAVIDSIMTNDMTCIGGPAGSGKSLLALAACLHLLKSTNYQRIVMLVNPTKAHGAADMGFYPGTSLEKLLSNFVGNMLSTKLGDQYAVDVLLNHDKLRIISMADVRGMEIRKGEILYMSESQNTSVELMKLCLSRVGEGAKVVMEGDYQTQVDSWAYTGRRNGMKRVIDTFKGSTLFGYIELQNVWRSPLADMIMQM